MIRKLIDGIKRTEAPIVVGLDPGSLTPQIAETQYWVIFLRKFQNPVYRNAVL